MAHWGLALASGPHINLPEQVYRDDLKRLLENGWSLYGLAESLSVQGKEVEATETRARFARIWVKADVAIKSSCFCQPGT